MKGLTQHGLETNKSSTEFITVLNGETMEEEQSQVQSSEMDRDFLQNLPVPYSVKVL
jgi:hypothetical protein